MGDLATVLTASGSFLGGLASIVVVLVTVLRRTSPGERRTAAEKATDRILEATADGKITPDEAAKLLRERYGKADQE